MRKRRNAKIPALSAKEFAQPRSLLPVGHFDQVVNQSSVAF